MLFLNIYIFTEYILFSIILNNIKFVNRYALGVFQSSYILLMNIANLSAFHGNQEFYPDFCLLSFLVSSCFIKFSTF